MSDRVKKIKAYKEFLDTDNGKKVLKDLSDFCGYNIDCHTPGDPYETAYKLGKQRVIRRIQGYLDLTDNQLSEILAQDEKIEEEQTVYDVLYNQN